MEDNSKMKTEVQNENPKSEKKQRKKMDKFSKILIGMSGAIVVGFASAVGIMIYSNSNREVQNLYGVPYGLRGSLGYNEEYRRFEGTNKRAPEVRSLIHMIEAHNNNQEEVAQYGSIIYNTKASDIDYKKYYTIEVNIGEGDGINAQVGSVSSIIITEQDGYLTN